MPDEKMTSTLRAISELEPTTNSEIAEHLGKSSSTISRRLDEIQENGWIEKTKAGRSNEITLSEQGEKALKIAPRGEKEREGQHEQVTTDAGEIRAHSYACEFGIHDSEPRTEWTRKVIEAEDLRFRELEDGSDLVFSDSYTARVRPEKIIIRVDEEIGEDAHELADRCLEKVQSARDDLEARLPFKLSYHPRNHRVRVREQEFAIMRHPFAEALIEDSDLSVEDVEFFEEEDNHRLWVDDSDGNRELESGKGAPYDEEDIQLLKEDLEHKVLNPEQTKRRRNITEEVDDLEDRIENIENATRVLLARELRKDGQREKERTGGRIRTRTEQDRNPTRGRRECPNDLRQGRDNSKSIKETREKLRKKFEKVKSEDQDLA